jgi:hypothetical protein
LLLLIRNTQRCKQQAQAAMSGLLFSWIEAIDPKVEVQSIPKDWAEQHKFLDVWFTLKDGNNDSPICVHIYGRGDVEQETVEVKNAPQKKKGDPKLGCRGKTNSFHMRRLMSYTGHDPSAESTDALPRNSQGKDAVFLGWQKKRVGEPLALYNITAKGHPSFGSTVTKKSLSKLNLKIPPTPFPQGRVKNA